MFLEKTDAGLLRLTADIAGIAVAGTGPRLASRRFLAAVVVGLTFRIVVMALTHARPEPPVVPPRPCLYR